MTHATKMALVPHDMIQRLQQQQQQYPDLSPTTKVTLALDSEMKNILARSDLSEEEKIKLYNQTLSRYLAVDSQRKQPLEMKVTTSSSHLLSTNEDDSSLNEANGSNNAKKTSGIENDVLNSVPNTLRKKADRLLGHIKSNRNIIDWNKKGEIITDGKVIPGTHLVDLVNDALRKRKNFNPSGWREFNSALAALNTPQDLVGNIDRWKYQQSGQQKLSSSTPQPTAETFDVTFDNEDDDGSDNSHVQDFDPSGLFAEAYHLTPSSSAKKKKKKKNRKLKHRRSYEDGDDSLVSSTTFPHRWSEY